MQGLKNKISEEKNFEKETGYNKLPEWAQIAANAYMKGLQDAFRLQSVVSDVTQPTNT